MWALVVLLCNTGTPYECSVKHVERHESRPVCLQAATDMREELGRPPVGYEHVRDCARRHAGSPILPTRRPTR